MPRQDTQAKPVRRRYTAAFKNELVRRSLQPGASVSGIALDGGVNTNLLFRWRRMHLGSERAARGAQARVAEPAVLLPVSVSAQEAQEAPAPQRSARTAPMLAGVIEIDIGQARVRLHGAVDPGNVRCVLHALRGLV